MKPPQTPFQKILRDILNVRGTYTVRAWKRVLGISPECWLKTLRIPSPENFRSIRRILHENRRFDKVRVRFEAVLDLRTHEAMGYYQPYVDVTLRHYMNRPLMDGFLRGLNLLTPQQQEQALYATAAMCRGMSSGSEGP